MARELAPRCGKTMASGRGCARPLGHSGGCRTVKPAVKPGGTLRQARETKAKRHAYAVKAGYGITIDDYWAIYKFQGGKCAICVRATGRSRRLAVDHDHSCTAGHDPGRGCSLCVRGLLCSRCNRFVGLLGDDPSSFRRAARYLEDPPWPIVRLAA